MDSAKNKRWIIPFKEFGMVRVKPVSTVAYAYFFYKKHQYKTKEACGNGKKIQEK